MLLRLKDVETYYGKVHALKGISLDINEGEIVCILGANGAGKSTILKAISGLVPVSKGSIEYQGKPLNGRSTADITGLRIAHVPEGRGMLASLTVAENLKLGTYARKDKSGLKEDYERVFGYFPILFKRKKQLAGTLSGGEQQMLAIARGMLLRPKLLMVDEPSLGLAPLVIQHVYEGLKKLSAEGVTLLLVEQNVRQALSISQRGYVLELGKVVLADTAKALWNHEDVRRAYLVH